MVDRHSSWEARQDLLKPFNLVLHSKMTRQDRSYVTSSEQGESAVALLEPSNRRHGTVADDNTQQLDPHGSF